MDFKNLIRKTTKYTSMAVAIVALTSWGILTMPNKNFPDKKSQQGVSENNEADAFTPVAYIIQLSSDNATLASDYDDIARKNIFGIAWRGDAADNLKFAKNMGYHTVTYRPGMQHLANAADIHFNIEKPENLMYNELGATLTITYSTTYTPTQINVFQNYYCLKNNTHPFPHNVANGWFTFNTSGKPTKFATIPDWQQKRVLDLALDLTVARAKELEHPERGFLFGGLSWDEPDITGNFKSDSAAFKNSSNTSVSLAFYTGGDSSRLHPGTTHEFVFHSDAKAAFYKELKSRFKQEFPGRKMVYQWEPYNINSDALHLILERPDKDVLLEDVLWVSEGGNAFTLTKFADDATLFEPGKLTRDWVGSTQPNEHRFDKIKEIVGKAGIHGSWFGWFGRFNEQGTGQINNIYDVPNWHQLARCIPSWDNLCGVPLSQRSFIGGVYLSSNSSMSNKVLYSRQHKTNKLFVVFMDPTATIPLIPGDQVLSVKRVDNYFIETTDAASELNITDNTISLATASSRAAKSNFFSVSPIPAKDYLSLKLADSQKQYSYHILDMSGKQVQTDLIRGSDTYIPIEKLTAGAYFIRLKEENKLVDSVKFIKE
jgi:hypothetical protein